MFLIKSVPCKIGEGLWIPPVFPYANIQKNRSAIEYRPALYTASFGLIFPKPVFQFHQFMFELQRLY